MNPVFVIPIYKYLCRNLKTCNYVALKDEFFKMKFNVYLVNHFRKKSMVTAYQKLFKS